MSFDLNTKEKQSKITLPILQVKLYNASLWNIYWYFSKNSLRKLTEISSITETQLNLLLNSQRIQKNKWPKTKNKKHVSPVKSVRKKKNIALNASCPDDYQL